MTDTLLRSLRERILDEDEPLAGLLRKCLLLGAETGSNALRDWARYELNGYGEDVELPNYRRLPSPPIKVDSISGNTWATGQVFDRLQLPIEAREAVPESFPLRQPVEELATLAASKSLSFSSTGLAYAQTVWNRQLGAFQQITGMTYSLPGSYIAGVLGQIRTQMVDIIADLTADTPLAELPKKAQVDAAVGQRIGTQYNTTIQATNGPTAIGTKSEATAKGLSMDDAIKLLDAVQRTASSEVKNAADQAELIAAIADLRSAVGQGTPATGDVVKKLGTLRAVADRIGVPTLTSAVGGAVEAFTSLAMTGAFG